LLGANLLHRLVDPAGDSTLRSAIILGTPSQAGLVNRTVNSSAKIKRLMRLWDSVIEPRVGAHPHHIGFTKASNSAIGMGRPNR